MSLPATRKYKILSSKNPHKLEEDLTAMLRDGWLPWGNPIATGDTIHQAMITEEVLDSYVDAVVPRATNIAKNYRGR